MLRVDDTDRNVNGTSSFLSTQVATLKSRDLAERVIRPHELGAERRLPAPERRAAGPRGSAAACSRCCGRAASSERGTASTGEDTSSTADVRAELLDRYMR